MINTQINLNTIVFKYRSALFVTTLSPLPHHPINTLLVTHLPLSPHSRHHSRVAPNSSCPEFWTLDSLRRVKIDNRKSSRKDAKPVSVKFKLLLRIVSKIGKKFLWTLKALVRKFREKAHDNISEDTFIVDWLCDVLRCFRTFHDTCRHFMTESYNCWCLYALDI